MLNLFIDIDGVLLGRPDLKSPKVALAAHAESFIRFATDHFTCHWLTTHCRGSTDSVIEYLRPYADEEFLRCIEPIRPTYFKTFKTEALFGSFIWLDDSPTFYEIESLRKSGLLSCWKEVNTYRDFNDLNKTRAYLESVLGMEQ